MAFGFNGGHGVFRFWLWFFFLEGVLLVEKQICKKLKCKEFPSNLEEECAYYA